MIVVTLEHEESFYRTRLDEERAQDKGRTVGVWFNNDELKRLEELAVWFHQPKESTTIKHCVELALAILEGRDQTATFRDVLFNNVRKNRRLGLEEIEPKFRIS